MIYEELRSIHEDVERLEQAIADRVLDDPQHIRLRLVRDHEMANFLARIQSQSERGLKLYTEQQGLRTQELQQISTGDPFQSFDEELAKLRDFHKRNPNEPVENLERAYKRLDEGGMSFAGDIDNMFTGEEGFGRFFDLTILHEAYLNLPGVKGVRKWSYLQYLDVFDVFVPPKCNIFPKQKMTEQYFSYVGSLAQYLESFMRRTRPLEDLDQLFRAFDEEFEAEWEAGTVVGWESNKQMVANGNVDEPVTEGSGAGLWCAACHKEFSNNDVYKSHLTGKKHMRNAKALGNGNGDSGGKAAEVKSGNNNNQNNTSAAASQGPNPFSRLKERAVAEREHRIRKLSGAMQTSREDTRVNVERKAGMTDKERQQELDTLYADDMMMDGGGSGWGKRENGGGKDEGNDDDEEGGEKIYNPLKLPLAWDGKPIPFWLYKLHGLGVEFSCEICGNYVYMGRRAFDKHFSEQRHIHGLQCLGITKNTGLFREITKIADAEKLLEKIERDRAAELERKGGVDGMGVIEMEDSEGNVMPKKVYDDLLKAGVL